MKNLFEVIWRVLRTTFAGTPLLQVNNLPITGFLNFVLTTLLVILLFPVVSPPESVKAADATTTITITKYDTDGTTILDQTTVTWEWMRDNLPVYGDSVTHYYHQGPTFDNSTFDTLWDPTELINIDSRDYGAAMGTDVKDLCELVGGASLGDVIKIKAIDNFSKMFDYEDIYNPEPEQGKLVITWYTTGTADGPDGFVPDYVTGMRLVFFAETLNPEGKHVFGDWDMHETLAESRWHYYYDGTFWPSSSGLSVKWVSNIEIYTSESEKRASDSLTATANVLLDSLGISLDRDFIDFGDIRPGESSVIETVIITNTGTVDINVTLEVQGEDETAQSFYEQSLYVDDSLYDINDIITSILESDYEDIDIQLKVPSAWDETGGEQQATFIFWATASH